VYKCVGRIFEMFLESTGKEKVCQLVHQLEQPHAITSLHFESYTSHGATASGAGDEEEEGEGPTSRIFVLCVTSSPTRLYHFIGGPTFMQLFIDYKNSGLCCLNVSGEEWHHVVCYSWHGVVL
jgi:hypothetical protein